MRIENEIKLDFKDVLIRPKRSTLTSRKDVDINRTFKFLHSGKTWTGTPVIASNMDTVGTVEMANSLSNHGCMTALHKHYTVDQLVDFYANSSDTVKSNTFYSLGILDHDVEKLDEVKKILHNNGIELPKFYCIDVANGYTESFVSFILKFRDNNKNATIMAGNVVTGEMAEELILSGVDLIKNGIGQGSACTTRKLTGVGYPQLSSVIEVADAVHGLGGLVCSDGGCTVPGDLAKAFGAGADFVMLGGMLAGTTEGGGEIIEVDGKQRVKFYGMSSESAQNKHNGGLKKYRASEGRTTLIPYKGSVEPIIEEISGGIRSACTYVGASKLKELSKRTTFVRVNSILNEVYEKYTIGK